MTREKAIEVVKEAMPTLWKETKDAIQTLIPELKENADERIREALIHIVKGACSKYGIKYSEVEITEEMLLTYLEKQKEQKPAERIEDSVKFKEGFKAGRESGLRDGQKYVLDNLDSYGLYKSADWNTADYEMLHLIIDYFESTKIPMKINTHDKVVDFKEIAEWLKSLRPQFHWKPSEVQMKALEYFIQKHKTEANAATGIWIDYENLVSLRNDLKKL